MGEKTYTVTVTEESNSGSLNPFSDGWGGVKEATSSFFGGSSSKEESGTETYGSSDDDG